MQHATAFRDQSRSLTGRIVELMRELDAMKARAGGWVREIPADELAMWDARKVELLAEIRDHRAVQP